MNEARGTAATCFGWWILDSFGARFLGLVKVLGEAGGLRVSREVVQLHDVGLREVVTLMGARG